VALLLAAAGYCTLFARRLCSEGPSDVSIFAPLGRSAKLSHLPSPPSSGSVRATSETKHCCNLKNNIHAGHVSGLLGPFLHSWDAERL